MILHSRIFGKGKPILVFHGLFGSGENWISFAEKFSQTYQVHLLDIRNHGKSFFSEKMNYDLISEDLLEYINYYNLIHPILIGHSMGGRAVMKFSINYPSIPKKIIIVDIGPRSYSSTYHKKIIQVLKNVDFDIIKTRKDLDLFLKSFISSVEIRSFFSKCTYRKKDGKLAFRFYLLGIENNYSYLIQEEIQGGIFDNPALFYAENIRIILSIKIFFAYKNFFQKQNCSCKKANHWIHVDNPIDFYREVSDFLSGTNIG
ncbi:alpha/beta superfamily hydrolase [Blattabacterium sp. (Blatta orientalis) str. Tarazona]|uniref:alpha/beta fold hydrolase n=1 Tax=Blattabacterium sp. (Blatta orientalis) TaxID=367806 RepID=UPI0002AD9272|nr:alpha/beta fold hydrolase [Blattabacterium sp. (Blatta orientalis)]AGD97934.1 alpha/beta superfamily hydrolase [Blattabacterium sp. (Blatta orientalis) str. Tarazona]